MGIEPVRIERIEPHQLPALGMIGAASPRAGASSPPAPHLGAIIEPRPALAVEVEPVDIEPVRIERIEPHQLPALGVIGSARRAHRAHRDPGPALVAIERPASPGAWRWRWSRGIDWSRGIEPVRIDRDCQSRCHGHVP